jgi:hypothetical protein
LSPAVSGTRSLQRLALGTGALCPPLLGRSSNVGRVLLLIVLHLFNVSEVVVLVFFLHKDVVFINLLELDLREITLVCCCMWFFLDNLRQDTVIEMLIELLCGGEGDVASTALAAAVFVDEVTCLRFFALGWKFLLPSIWWLLFDIVDRHEMSFEDIRTVERLLHGGSGTGAKAANHGALVVRQCVPLAVVFAGKPLLGVFAGRDGAFLGPFQHVGELMCAQVAETLVALAAKRFFPVLSTAIGAIGTPPRGAIGSLRRRARRPISHCFFGRDVHILVVHTVHVG